MEKNINVLLIGVGPNAQRAYLPALFSMQKSEDTHLAAIVELKSQQSIAQHRLQKAGFDLDTIDQTYVNDDLIDYRLSPGTHKKMDALFERHDFSAVIISTDPLAHKAYALWALEHGLAILMDKPISTQHNVTHDSEIGRNIYTDYLELTEAYHKSATNIFAINAQRRHHPGFRFVFDKVAEIAEQFNMPITSMQSLHADGQWRLPEEMATIDYHGYNKGIGKVSHSGYHFIDLIATLIKISNRKASPQTKPDALGVFSSFVRPRGILTLNPQENYKKIFGDEYSKVSPKSTAELYDMFDDYGEVDVSSVIQLLRKDDIVANITLNLLHNSFSRRAWLAPNADLYKGNGRVKHEYHNIQQGPLQNIQIHSYQKSDRHDVSTEEDMLVGGNNHFDVLIFRNNGITGDEEPLQKYSMKDFSKPSYAGTYVHDTLKNEVVTDFVKAVRENSSNDTLIAPFEDQELTTLLMSLIYQSGASHKHVKESIARLI